MQFTRSVRAVGQDDVVIDDASLVRAAFGDLPGADVSAISPADRPTRRWLAGVVLGAQGRYAAAATLLGPLRAVRDPVLASLAASTLAAHRRQLGGHVAARRLDAEALTHLAQLGRPGVTRSVEELVLAEAAGVTESAARVDALLGLAADAVGLGRVDEARRLLAAAERELGLERQPERRGRPGRRGGAGETGPPPLPQPADWRGQVRAGWVGAEIELAAGRAEAAVPLAEAAGRLARTAGAARHVLKSDLVLGTALAVAGQAESGIGEVVAGSTVVGRDEDAAGSAIARLPTCIALLGCVLNHTVDLGLLSLVWPAALVLAQHAPDESAELLDWANNALSCVLRAADPIGRRIAAASPWVPSALLHSGEPPNAAGWAKFLTDKAPDRVKVGAQASDRGCGTSLGCRKESP
ncbi:hypothetical protein [Goodfellowiella coeruleoviolacea]|uniref:hypothetical protein n=1 Tax=Goodfellowiella coeruleoviolacea TaxID=334858 RepID=UPI0020A4D231|nr:hypothetical protein [Goodfellowiella coeruleoviolacea]